MSISIPINFVLKHGMIYLACLKFQQSFCVLLHSKSVPFCSFKSRNVFQERNLIAFHQIVKLEIGKVFRLETRIVTQVELISIGNLPIMRNSPIFATDCRVEINCFDPVLLQVYALVISVFWHPSLKNTFLVGYSLWCALFEVPASFAFKAGRPFGLN